MSDFNKNENMKVVGFFGQSGSGKTTIIRNVDKRINGHIVVQNTGIIRYLFKKNNYYKNPLSIIADEQKAIDATPPEERDDKIASVYEIYIRSQIRLLNDWSTEVYIATKEKCAKPTILLLDRSPIDFYVITICGIQLLIDAFGKELDSNAKYFIRLNKKIAEDNTNNFFDSIFITKPWSSSNINTLRDGIRDQYLSDNYTGDNWYSHYDTMEIKSDIKKFIIEESVTDLYKRAKFVSEKLKEI